MDVTAGTATVTTDDFSPFVVVDLDEFERIWAQEITVPRDGTSGTSDPIDTAVVLDSSGSMSWNDPGGARRTAGKAFIDALVSGDRAAVVDFDDWATVLQALTADLDAAKSAIDQVDSSGGTSIAAGLEAALDQLDSLGEPGRGRVVVLLTDGEGYYDQALTTRAASSGTRIYTVGLGSSVNSPLLDSIATGTGGRYHQVQNAADLVDTFERIGGDIGAPDTDGDGLADTAETPGMRTGTGRVYTTDPTNPDTDGDGLSDGQEMGPLTAGGPFGAGTFFKDFSAPTLSDTDADGLNDAQEADADTHPRMRDTDGDGLSDLTEIEYQFDPTTINADGDFLFDDEELAAGSDPLIYDFDTAGAVHAATSGLVFGDAWDTTAARWAQVTLGVATSPWYMLGTLASGFVVLGDIRDRPGRPHQLADRRPRRSHRLRRGRPGAAPGPDPDAARAARPGHRRERPPDHRPPGPVHRWRRRRPAARRPAAGARPGQQGPAADRPGPHPHHRGRGPGAPARSAARQGHPVTTPIDRTPDDAHRAAGGGTALVRSFPPPGPLVQLALRELFIAATGTPEQTRKLGNVETLARPWQPATCGDPDLRAELWSWLDQVVEWVNHEHVWDVTCTVPACWPRHPHLVHDIAVLADQRRRAGTALTSDPLEEWHRYALPTFLDRVRTSTKTLCEDGHQPWPARGRHTRHTGPDSRRARDQGRSGRSRRAPSPSRRSGRAGWNPGCW